MKWSSEAMLDNRNNHSGFVEVCSGAAWERRRLADRCRKGLAGLALCAYLVAAGCNKPPGVNPWRDDSISSAVWTTPSEQGILAAGHDPMIRHRDVSGKAAPVASGDVPHDPLWWEDPFEDQGDMDGQFAWTWQDYLAMPYSYARWHLNTLAFPVSAVVTPPGTPMVSDGVLEPGHPHDAKRGVSPDPSASPLDFGVEEEGEGAPHSAEPNEPPATAPGT